jgi:CRP/FNR family cyclic AMP-dependent transcriptional regulator
MNSPYSPDANGGYTPSKQIHAEFSCQLVSAASKEFAAIESAVTYPKGTILFLEGQQAKGVFLLCRGEVKLSISSSEGKKLIVRVAHAGDFLGLMAALSGGPYEVTAEAIYPCEAAFVRREEFLRYVRKYPEASRIVAKQVSAQYQAICERLRTIGLSASVYQRLARLLLSWPTSREETIDGAVIRLSLTHEEMAEFIGTTRETVTRALSEFRQRRLIALHGSRLVIPSRAALETFVGA